MADPENALPEATDGIYFAVPRRILEDELDWSFSDKKPPEKHVAEPEQDVPSLRNDHPRLMDHFGPDVDEYLLKCSLDKFESHTVASFRKDVITQLSAATENNSIKTPRISLDLSSSDEDLFTEDPKKQRYSSIYKNNVSYSKQGRLFQKSDGVFLPKTQGFLKTDLDIEENFTEQCHDEGFYFVKNTLDRKGQRNKLGLTTGKSDSEVEDENVSKYQRQEDWVCLQQSPRIKSKDKVLIESQHQKENSNELYSAEELKEESGSKLAQENFKVDSRQKDDLTPECLQECPKAKTRTISQGRNQRNDLNLNSAKDTKAKNKSDSICSNTHLEIGRSQKDVLNRTPSRGSTKVKIRDDDSIGSLCQKSGLSSIDDREDFEVKNVNTVMPQLQQNIEGKIEQMTFINCQANDLGSINLQKDLKAESKEIEESMDLNLSSTLKRDEQSRDNGVVEIENQREDAGLCTQLKDLQSKDKDNISRKELHQISDSDLTSALQILKTKSRDIISKQSVFLHSMINPPSGSAAKSSCSQRNVSHCKRQKREVDECEEKKGEETQDGHASLATNEEDTEEGKDEKNGGEEVRQSGSETQVTSEGRRDEDEDKGKIGEQENWAEMGENEDNGDIRQNGNEALIIQGEHDKDIEQGKEEVGQSKNEAQEINEGGRDEGEDNERDYEEMKQIEEESNEGKRDAPESDILIAAQQVADSCQIQTSDSDSANDQTSKDKRGIRSDSHTPELSVALSAMTLESERDGHSDEKEEISEGVRPKCLPRTSKSLPNKSSQSTPGQIHENYKFFREKSSRFFVSDVILEEEEADALSKTSEVSRRYRSEISGAPTPSPRSIKSTELSSDVLIISVSDEDSNETIKTVVSVKKPDPQRSPLETSPLNRLAAKLEPKSASPDPLDWAKFLSRDFPVDPSHKDPGKAPEWDLSPTLESSSSLWLSCSEDERQANLLNYDLFRTDFSEADPDLNTHWPFTDSQPTNCLNVFHSECYALHL